MTDYPVQCYDCNGEPYGRYVNNFKIDYDTLKFNVPGWLSEDIERDEVEFEAFADENTFPFPSGTIGKTYERDEVEVVLQYFAEWNGSEEWFDCDRDWFDAISRKSVCPTREIFRLVISKTETTTQPVDHSKTCESCQQTTLLAENDRQDQPVEKEPETVDQAEHKKITGFDTPAERISYEEGYNDAISVCMDYIRKWKGKRNSELGMLLDAKFQDWQKKQEASR